MLISVTGMVIGLALASISFHCEFHISSAWIWLINTNSPDERDGRQAHRERAVPVIVERDGHCVDGAVRRDVCRRFGQCSLAARRIVPP